MREEEGKSQAVRERVRRVQENIVGNEALGGSLDEAAASEMLSWSLKSAEGIASSTEGMDDETAELSMADRLKALRKLMRHLGRLLGEGLDMDAEGKQWLWDSVQKHARMLYGESLLFPNLEDVMERLSGGESAGQIITSLRKNFEAQNSNKQD
ncbi:MAG: hypothetical protein PVJ21_00240 [Anaerolineales bacterium]|jgi:hypothetical protein